MKYSYCIILSILVLLSISCEKVIKLDLPEYENELVIESYLEVDFPYIVSVTESVSFFEPISLPVVNDLIITIEHLGEIDTLELIDSLGVYVDTDFSHVITQADEFPYTLTVYEPSTGRTATSSTQFLEPVPIDTITYEINSVDEAAPAVYFTDVQNEENYYYIVFSNANTLDFDSIYTRRLSDKLFENQQTLRGVSFKYRKGDDLEVKLFHIPEEYFRFLDSTDEAGDALDNPVSRPARVISNIEGGLGIFTALSYDSQIVSLE